jgi:hypothetical protein
VSDVTVPPPTGPSFQAGTPSTSAEAIVHALIGAQFGDLEFDVGKSVRWTQWFSDDVFITDINTGSQRYWVVNWELTYPQAYHAITGVNFFYDMAAFRREQWREAKAEQALQYDPDDWVLFVDAHEGLCIDSRDPQPNDVGIEPFRSYLYREISRANTAGKDRVYIPFYVFLRHDDIITAHYDSPAFADGSLGFTTATASMATPYYLSFQGLPRLIKVSALDSPSFDWNSLDKPTQAGDSGLNISLVSYGYAHWYLQDIVPPATTVPPLDADNDDGWRMRNLLSAVRPVPTIPYGATWQPPASDPRGIAGPWAAADQNTPDPEESQPVAPDASLAGLLVPLYDTFIRINYRDGVWYEGGELGNIPLEWDEFNQIWKPRNMSPQDWHDTQTWVAPVV